MIVKEPSMTVEDTRPAVVQAETMVSGPVKVTHGDKSWTLTAEQIAASMGFRVRIETASRRWPHPVGG